ncbi:sigma-70 family RNA polymerase sigma factor [Ruania zhangjianzhongii]|uniref:sigma-70 family RNA polymerase sigma factor n=1 Tax=Ruania zhangjianzhongii TaxID=2603206 RepID=UPI0011CB6CD9|nr:sigma-70 family RNA polymerase sigma factor [Ruania zhangjianzhongii]
MAERTPVATGAQPAGTGVLAERFAAQRRRLHAIATRMLGSHWDADDAVQETWIRLQRSDADSIENVEAWLTTVISRICVDQLRRTATRQEDLGAELPEPEQTGGAEHPEAAALTGDAVNMALLVLEELPPLERLAFVLHDVFGLPFDDIAPIVQRSSPATRQLASRARKRVARIDVHGERRRRSDAVDAFLRASRDGDFRRLLQVLDPEIRVRADSEVIAASAPFVAAGAPVLAPSLRGADAVARAFAGRASLARRALIDGAPGAVYLSEGTVAAAYLLHLQEGRIVQIEVIGNAERLDALDITAVQDPDAAR